MEDMDSMQHNVDLTHDDKEARLADFFRQNPVVALGFSGGVDSSYLLYAGLKMGATVHAYFIKTAFQPAFELADAQRLAAEVGAQLIVIELDILSDKVIAVNPNNRCYYCKKAIFGTLRRQAAADGIPMLIDGSNASDDSSDRPGMKALSELKVRSPLRECGFTKSEVRHHSKVAGLFTWNKPAYACLATRIPAGQTIDPQQLTQIEGCENGLFRLGFCDFRVRVDGDRARLQLAKSDFPLLADNYVAVMAVLGEFFDDAVLDLVTVR
jgi:uncharacterized protein